MKQVVAAKTDQTKVGSEDADNAAPPTPLPTFPTPAYDQIVLPENKQESINNLYGLI